MAESQTATVCRLAADDWQVYRAVRLAMLRESPLAFGSTYDEAAGYGEQLWRQRLTENVVILARVGTVPAGSVMYSENGRVDSADAVSCSLYGMWVDPGFRRAGVGRALIDAVISQARAAGKRRVVLNVVAGNDTAGRLYEGSGFVPTGHTFPYPHDDRVIEVEMELVLQLGADQGNE
jgi:ribosomal protein S18 acetylase RimI-like enzyme